MSKSKIVNPPIGSIESLVGIPPSAGLVKNPILKSLFNTRYKEYLYRCEKLNVEPLFQEDLWEDHLYEINEAIDYKGFYP